VVAIEGIYNVINTHFYKDSIIIEKEKLKLINIRDNN
jgi:hypothetical protein